MDVGLKHFRDRHVVVVLQVAELVAHGKHLFLRGFEVLFLLFPGRVPDVHAVIGGGLEQVHERHPHARATLRAAREAVPQRFPFAMLGDDPR